MWEPVHPYFPVLLLIVLGVGFSGAFVVLSYLIGRPKRSRTDLSPYECGVPSKEGARDRFSVKFFLVALLFILFDVEAVFLFPWAMLFKDFQAMGMGLFIFGEMVLFIGVLALGLVYVWKRGALEWS
ncbi:MAG: NADH-quinone oxidoreductase subunit A [Deltaproteobacteria bacterium]|nr:NADH-quinone oxidoreductase subunit A [Deltaproteobacteria bacterium]